MSVREVCEPFVVADIGRFRVDLIERNVEFGVWMMM